MPRNTPGKRLNPLLGRAWDNTSRTACSGRAKKSLPMQPIKGLYAVTPDVADTAALISQVENVLAAGARLLQYRNKTVDDAKRHEQADALAQLCRRYAATFIVNDDVKLAAAVNADGVHVGADD